jgi:hypothetical protein
MLPNWSYQDLYPLSTGIDRQGEMQFMSATAIGGTFDQASVKEIMVRWRVADEYLSYLDVELLPREHALRVLVGQDVPSLLKEVIRLRPDLA